MGGPALTGVGHRRGGGTLDRQEEPELVIVSNFLARDSGVLA